MAVDVGFKVFKLDSSNLNVWDDTPIMDDVDVLLNRMAGYVDGLKTDRSDKDLIYEILLKMGYPLTIDFLVDKVSDVTVYKVSNGDMFICLQPGITAEHIEKLAEQKPKKIVISESALIDDSAMSNAYYLLENRSIELKII